MGPHQFNDLPGLKAKLLANGIKRGSIFPCHLNNSIGLGRAKLSHWNSFLDLKRHQFAHVVARPPFSVCHVDSVHCST